MPLHTWHKVAWRFKKRVPHSFENEKICKLLSKSNRALSDKDADKASKSSPDPRNELLQPDIINENIADWNAATSHTILSPTDSADSGIRLDYQSDSSSEPSHINLPESKSKIEEEFNYIPETNYKDITTTENTIDNEIYTTTLAKGITDIKIGMEYEIDYGTSQEHLDILDLEDNISCEFDPEVLSAKLPDNQQTSLIENKLSIDNQTQVKNIARVTIFAIIEREHKMLLGLSKKTLCFLKQLSRDLAYPNINILITMKKMRLNEPYSLLALQFACRECTISRIIPRTIVFLAANMKELIKWPTSSMSLECNKLTKSFLARYSHVASIIDCLEIEIDKPFDADNPSRSWSQYKKCHTVKYLISYTPEGLISFISHGYGGAVSDVSIVEQSGFLDHVPPNKAVVANGRFEGISKLFEGKDCSLITLHSILNSTKSAKDNIKHLRYHTERIRSRVREFNVLLPVCFDNKLLPVLDEIVVVACGIINLNNS